MATGTHCMETAITTQPKQAQTPTPSVAVKKQTPVLRTFLFCSAAAMLSGVLLFLCFFPVAWGSYLGWFALAPMLVLVRVRLRPALILLGALLGGLAFFIPALSWMRVADRSMILGWMMLSTYCALYIPAAIFCVRGLERWKLPLIVSLPVAWTALEFFRSFFLTGFPWYFLAHTQHEVLSMIQITDIGGVFLVSFVVAVVNAFLFDCVYQFPEIRRWFDQAELEPYRYYSSLEILNRSTMADCHFRRNLILEAVAVALLVIGTYAYGLKRLGEDRFPPGPVVCLLQSNLDQRMRENAAEPKDAKGAAQTVREHYHELVRVGSWHQQKPDLLIWPETSYPIPWFEISPQFPVEKLTEPEFVVWRDNRIYVQEELKLIARGANNVPNLLGMNSYFLTADGKSQRHNKAVLVGGDGKVIAKHDKIHRLPFGEYIPLKSWLPFLAMLTPYEGDFGIQAGEKFTRFDAGPYRFGVLICFEDTDPFLARRFVQNGDDGGPVDFLVNMSNDGWFDGSSEHEEHLAVSRFRAIECRRAMVRAVNMGVSAVIDGNGRVLKPRELPGPTPTMWAITQDMTGVPTLPASAWHQFKQKAGVILAAVPLDRRSSFYAFTGDWLPIGCWLALLGCASWGFVRRKLALRGLA